MSFKSSKVPYHRAGCLVIFVLKCGVVQICMTVKYIAMRAYLLLPLLFLLLAALLLFLLSESFFPSGFVITLLTFIIALALEFLPLAYLVLAL